ncbi:hypothetical protein VPHD479_0027 [Vibrio phage D479]
MKTFSEFHYENILGVVRLDVLDEAYAQISNLLTTAEVQHLMDTETPEYQWKFDSDSQHHFAKLQSNPDAMRAVMNTIYEVAYKGNASRPDDKMGKSKNGWAFKGKFTQPIWHSKPHPKLIDGMNPNNPRQPDPIALVWWRNGKTITFGLWSHKEYQKNIDKFRR